jgi:hypothetical protein
MDLQPDGGDFAEEGGSEDVSHLLPAIRPLPEDAALAEGAYYIIKLADMGAGAQPRQLGQLLGTAFFAALSDMAVFGRDDANTPYRELTGNDMETKHMLVAMELVPSSGNALAEDEFPMFDMVASRVAKKLERPKQPAAEQIGAAVARSQRLASLKGKFSMNYTLKVTGSFDAAQITDSALSIGLKREPGGFVWVVNAQPIFHVKAQGLQLAAGATGKTAAIEFSFQPAKLSQPKKALERMVTCANYFIKRLGGQLTTSAGTKAATTIMTGEDAQLAKLIQDMNTAGLKPGNVVSQRLA